MLLFFFFFFNDTATTEFYTLSLHDALPISAPADGGGAARAADCCSASVSSSPWGDSRSEEHTSELQSHLNLVCRLLLEKKKKKKKTVLSSVMVLLKNVILSLVQRGTALVCA